MENHLQWRFLLPGAHLEMYGDIFDSHNGGVDTTYSTIGRRQGCCYKLKLNHYLALRANSAEVEKA